MFRSGLLVQSLLWTVSSSIVQVSLDSSGKIEAFRPHSKRQKLLRREAANASLIHEDELEHYDLLILIPASLRRDRARLSAIRETWTRDIDTTTHFCARCRSNRTLKYLFLLGDEADPDSEEMQAADVVALPSSSAYDRLAEKVRGGIHYAVQHYSFHLMLKADTDSWIFIDRLLNFAEEHDLFGPRRAAQAGEVCRKGRPQGGGRNPDGVFTKLTGQETYPVYSPGCGYLLTRDLCNYISMLAPEEDDARSESEELPTLQDLPQEDVSVGFWLEAVEHEHISMPLSIMGDACRKSDGQSMVLDHYVPEGEMRRRWANLQQTGDPCEEA